jgi:hypothetical protein
LLTFVIFEELKCFGSAGDAFDEVDRGLISGKLLSYSLREDRDLGGVVLEIET